MKQGTLLCGLGSARLGLRAGEGGSGALAPCPEFLALSARGAAKLVWAINFVP